MKRLLHFAASLVLAGAATLANAVDTDPPAGAHEVVRQATHAVMSVVEEADTYIDEEPERFYSQLEDILDTVVDFRGFARGVMGPYASSERYRSLDSDGRKQLTE